MPLLKPNWRYACFPMLVLWATWPVEAIALTEQAAVAIAEPGKPTDDTAYATTLGTLIRSNLVFTSPARLSDTVEARIALRVDGYGKVIDARVGQSSGSSNFDAAMLAAVRKSLPFPPPPEHRVRWVNLTFRPGGASASAVASASPTPPEITIAPPAPPIRADVSRAIFRQKDVAHPDADGWTTARSADGRFSLSVPGRFSDKTVWFAHPGAQAAKSAETVLAHGEGGTSLFATRLQFDGREVATRRFEALEETYRARDAHLERAPLLGHPSLGSRMQDMQKSELVVERFVLVGADILWVHIAGPMALADAVERDASRIVGSLRIDAAPTNLGSPPEEAFDLPD